MAAEGQAATEPEAVKDTTARGDRTEVEVATALVRRGNRLLRPLSSATRYDLLIDHEDGTFTRVQCKTGVLRHGCVLFRLYSISGHNTVTKPYRGEVDAFRVFCPDTNSAYLVPVKALEGRTNIAGLRVAPARNGQRKRTRNAAEFLVS